MTNMVELQEVVDINPRIPKSLLATPERKVSFLPMAAVSEEGVVLRAEERALKDVVKGYTYFQRGDVLLAKITPCFENGKAAVVDDLPHSIGFGSTEFHVLRPENDINSKYLFHLIWNPRFRFIGERNMTGTAGQKRVPVDFLKRYEIPLPPLPEQKRISAILDKADAIRRKRQQAIQLADDLLRSVFLDMFGDLIKNSKRWDIVRFGDVGQLRLGKMLDAKQQTGNNRRKYLRNANIQWDRIDLSGLLEMDFGPKDRQIFKLKHGDLLVCEGGEVGRSAIWRDELPECYFQKALHRIRPNTKKATPEFLLHLMWFFARNGGFKDHTSSVTIPHLTGVKLKDMRIPLPPLNLQEKFSQRYYAVRKIKDRSWKLSALGDNLFGSLTQRAFRGEL
jgi:type I restriction enzyme S subunit